MEITEQQWYDALGVEGAKEQEPAEPAAPPAEEPPQAEGAKEQEPAEPAAQTETEPAETEQQIKERNREAAAQRRRQEQQAAIDAAIAKEREEQNARMKDFFGKAGLKNTLTGAAIESLEDFEKWRDEYAAKQMEEDLKKGKLTKETLDNAIANNPAVKKANEIIEKNNRDTQQAQLEAAKIKAEAEIAEIGKIDPTITDINSLISSKNGQQIIEYVRKGLNFKDAYYLANREDMQAKAVETAKQQAALNARGKDHLSATKGAGTGAAPVPRDEMQMFKLFNPKATDAQIQEYYNKHQKG